MQLDRPGACQRICLGLQFQKLINAACRQQNNMSPDQVCLSSRKHEDIRADRRGVWMGTSPQPRSRINHTRLAKRAYFHDQRVWTPRNTCFLPACEVVVLPHLSIYLDAESPAQ